MKEYIFCYLFFHFSRLKPARCLFLNLKIPFFSRFNVFLKWVFLGSKYTIINKIIHNCYLLTKSKATCTPFSFVAVFRVLIDNFLHSSRNRIYTTCCSPLLLVTPWDKAKAVPCHRARVSEFMKSDVLFSDWSEAGEVFHEEKKCQFFFPHERREEVKIIWFNKITQEQDDEQATAGTTIVLLICYDSKCVLSFAHICPIPNQLPSTCPPTYAFVQRFAILRRVPNQIMWASECKWSVKPLNSEPASGAGWRYSQQKVHMP